MCVGGGGMRCEGRAGMGEGGWADDNTVHIAKMECAEGREEEHGASWQVKLLAWLCPRRARFNLRLPSSLFAARALLLLSVWLSCVFSLEWFRFPIGRDVSLLATEVSLGELKAHCFGIASRNCTLANQPTLDGGARIRTTTHASMHEVKHVRVRVIGTPA